MNLRQYLKEKYQIDDSNFAIRLPEHVDVLDDRFEEGGPIIAVSYCRDPEEQRKCRENLIQIVKGMF